MSLATVLTSESWFNGGDARGTYGHRLHNFHGRASSPFAHRKIIQVKENNNSDTNLSDNTGEDHTKKNGYKPSTLTLDVDSSGSDSDRGPDEVTLRTLDDEHDCLVEGCNRIVINVAGTKYETQLRTINRFPNTLMGNPLKRAKLWDERRQEYFIDRHRLAFQSILNWYQTGGNLKRPIELQDDVFIEEMEYYELGDDVITEYKLAEGMSVPKEDPMPKNAFQKKVWLLCEHPSSSNWAKVFGLVSVIVIMLSIVAFCIETLPTFEALSCVNKSSTDSEGVLSYEKMPNYENPFFIIETFCIVWFSLELCIRFASCPNKCKFLKDIMNIFDFAAIAPYFLMLIIDQFVNSCAEGGISLSSLRVIRLLRVTRVFKLSKHSTGLKILGLTITASLNELAMFVFFLLISIILFSAMMYYAEHQTNASFSSIPAGFWWAIVTMTTVGYGDLYPMNIWGKLIGTVCLIAGLLAIALPVPIIVTNFNKFYMQETGRGFN